MTVLDKRLEIRLDQETFVLLQEKSRKLHKSIGELIRTAIESLYIKKGKKKRLLAAKRLCQINAPVANWGQMKKEAEQGYA